VDLADLCDGEVIYYASDANNAHIQQHLAKQGRAVYFANGQVMMSRGTHEQSLLQLDFPAIAKNLANGTLNLYTLLASVAVAWALDMTPDLIRAGLKNYGQPSAIANVDLARMKA
jgi:cyanophycin synthetase